MGQSSQRTVNLNFVCIFLDSFAPEGTLSRWLFNLFFNAAGASPALLLPIHVLD